MPLSNASSSSRHLRHWSLERNDSELYGSDSSTEGTGQFVGTDAAGPRGCWERAWRGGRRDRSSRQGKRCHTMINKQASNGVASNVLTSNTEIKTCAAKS